MAQNTDISVPKEAWTQLTDADVSSITFQNKSGNFVLIKGTTSASTPTNADGAIRYNPGQGEPNTSLADMFPGISAVRLYAYAPEGALIMVSHA
jgi:uncharacterized protein with WD repeat